MNYLFIVVIAGDWEDSLLYPQNTIPDLSHCLANTIGKIVLHVAFRCHTKHDFSSPRASTNHDLFHCLANIILVLLIP